MNVVPLLHSKNSPCSRVLCNKTFTVFIIQSLKKISWPNFNFAVLYCSHKYFLVKIPLGRVVIDYVAVRFRFVALWSISVGCWWNFIFYFYSYSVCNPCRFYRTGFVDSRCFRGNISSNISCSSPLYGARSNCRSPAIFWTG